MTKKLVQKRFLKGMREFVIIDEMITVTNKSLFKEEKITVEIAMLDPEPVVKGAELAFYNPHKGRPVFTMLLNKPNESEFNHFVETLKRSISGEDVGGTPDGAVSPETAESALAQNVYEEPPEYEESREAFGADSVNVERLEDDITMLRTYLDDERFNPLFEALESLKAEPANEAAFQDVVSALNELGVYQGKVLTYAPYLIVLVSKYT